MASLHLFALYTEIIMREIDMDGFRIGESVINNLRHRYADVTVIISDSEEQLQSLIYVVVTESKEVLYVNRAKSFTMLFSKS